jgi:hypothetical protein
MPSPKLPARSREPAGRREFQDAKFAMFIHRGVYSLLGSGQWIFHDRALTVDVL